LYESSKAPPRGIAEHNTSSDASCSTGPRGSLTWVDSDAVCLDNSNRVTLDIKTTGDMAATKSVLTSATFAEGMVKASEAGSDVIIAGPRANVIKDCNDIHVTNCLENNDL